jgi:hypothetical protein
VDQVVIALEFAVPFVNDNMIEDLDEEESRFLQDIATPTPIFDNMMMVDLDPNHVLAP